MAETVKVTIAGIEYAIKTDEAPEFTKEIAAEIDSKINEIKRANPTISTMQIAILVAMQYCFDCKDAQKKTEEIRGEIKSYLEDAANAQSERDFYKREIERMKDEAKSRTNQINLFDTNDEA